MLLTLSMGITPFANIQAKADTTIEVTNTDATAVLSETSLGTDVKAVTGGQSVLPTISLQEMGLK